MAYNERVCVFLTRVFLKRSPSEGPKEALKLLWKEGELSDAR